MNTTTPSTLGMVLKGYPRISETFISNEILLLEKLGLPIHLFSMRHPREPFTHRSVQRIRASVDYLPQTLLRPLPRFLYHNALLAAQNRRRYTRAFGLAARRYRRTHKSATWKHLLQAGYLVQRLLPDSGVGHFHAHFAHSPSSVAFFASQLSGRPFSFTAHAKDIYTSDHRQLREKIEHAEFVVTCTRYNQQVLRRIAPQTKTPIYCVYHGIDLKLFAEDRPVHIPRPPFKLLTVARMAPKKGLPTVYKALQHLRDMGLDVRHTLIGDGDERAQIMALVQQLGLGGVTQVLGTQPHHVVLDHYREADVFVLGCQIAANGDRDGIPNVFMESMAMGVPVVATDVSAIPELIDDGQSGLLVAPEQPQEMARAVQRMLMDKDLRHRVIRTGRQRIEATFDNRQLILKLARIYANHIRHLAQGPFAAAVQP